MENVCRICLCSPNQLQPLFDGTQLNEKIRIISSVVMEENDGFPNSVCADCIINVNTCYNFRLVVINSDVQLRQRGTESSKLIVIDEETSLLTSEYIIKGEESDPDLKQTEDGEERVVIEERVIKVEEVESDKPELKIYECEKCGFITQDVRLYLKHIRRSTSRTSICKVESDQTVIKSRKCRKCDFVTEDVELFRKHNRVGNHKSRGIKKYTCNECDFVTDNNKVYFKHKRTINHKSQTRVCSICGKMVGLSSLSSHLKSHEAIPTECKICGKVCKNSESLRDHKRLHKDPKICEYCGKSCNRRTYYIHVKQHHKGGLKELKCSYCEKVFFYSKSLKKHIQSHTGERPYICEFCQKGFSSTDALKTHRRQHTNEKPYQCKLCPLAFKQRVLLRNHLKTKHPGQEYSF